MRNASWTAVLCKFLQMVSYSSARMVLLDRHWVIEGRNLVWRVCFLIRGPVDWVRCRGTRQIVRANHTQDFDNPEKLRLSVQVVADSSVPQGSTLNSLEHLPGAARDVREPY